MNRERIDGVKLLVGDDEKAFLEKNKQLIAYWVLLSAIGDGMKLEGSTRTQRRIARKPTAIDR